MNNICMSIYYLRHSKRIRSEKTGWVAQSIASQLDLIQAWGGFLQLILVSRGDFHMKDGSSIKHRQIRTNKLHYLLHLLPPGET